MVGGALTWAFHYCLLGVVTSNLAIVPPLRDAHHWDSSVCYKTNERRVVHLVSRSITAMCFLAQFLLQSKINVTVLTQCTWWCMLVCWHYLCAEQRPGHQEWRQQGEWYHLSRESSPSLSLGQGLRLGLSLCFSFKCRWRHIMWLVSHVQTWWPMKRWYDVTFTLLHAVNLQKSFNLNKRQFENYNDKNWEDHDIHNCISESNYYKWGPTVWIKPLRVQI